MKAPQTPAEAKRRNRKALSRAQAHPAATVEALRALWKPGDPTHETTGPVVEDTPEGRTTRTRSTPTPAFTLAWWIDALHTQKPATVVEALHERDAGEDGLTLLAWGVERIPEDEAAVSRPDPILPRTEVEVREQPARVAGKLAFGVAGREVPGDPGQLPLIEAPDLLRVPLLELCDWNGVPVTQQGGGAPHALAVYVSAMLVTPLNNGRGERSIIATVRDLKEHLFPGRWNAGRDWPRVRRALIVADSLLLPEVYRTPSGFRQPWRAVALRTCPGEVWERGMLDAEIRLAVEHPPNASGDGPILERAELARLRASDGPKYRAYIGAHSLLWRPGATRVKYRGRWYWTRERARYPIVTAADRDRIAFASEGERRKHSRAVKDAAWEDLSGIRILDRAADTPDGRRGWRLAPEGAGPE